MSKKMKNIKSMQNGEIDEMNNSVIWFEERYKGKLGLMCPLCYNTSIIKIDKKMKTKYNKNNNIRLISFFDGDCKVCKQHVVYTKIDGNISKTIEILNKKGYYTDFCCEGHKGHDSCNAYISFANSDGYTHIKDILPDSWYIDMEDLREDSRLIIRAKKNIPLEKRIEDIQHMAENLHSLM